MLQLSKQIIAAELTRYLSDNWAPIIEKDVDGSGSLPLKIDGEVPNLGKLHATRRVARTITSALLRPLLLRREVSKTVASSLAA
jgi:hypothetical protein